MFVKSLVVTRSLAILLQLTGSNNKMALNVLSILSDIVIRDHDAVTQFRMAGSVLYLLRVLLQRRERNLRVVASEIMCKMTADAVHGVQMSEYLCTFLTPKFASKFEQKADKFLEFFDSDHESDHKKWDESTRDQLSFFCEKHVKVLDRSADSWNGTIERFDVALLVEVYPEPVVVEQEPEPVAAAETNDTAETEPPPDESSNMPPLAKKQSFHPENIPLPLSARSEDDTASAGFDTSF